MTDMSSLWFRDFAICELFCSFWRNHGVTKILIMKKWNGIKRFARIRGKKQRKPGLFDVTIFVCSILPSKHLSSFKNQHLFGLSQLYAVFKINLAKSSKCIKWAFQNEAQGKCRKISFISFPQLLVYSHFSYRVVRFNINVKPVCAKSKQETINNCQYF